MASFAWMLATTATAVLSTPAVSHVGTDPGGGGSRKTQRRQGPSPGTMVMVMPDAPITPPYTQGMPR